MLRIGDATNKTVHPAVAESRVDDDGAYFFASRLLAVGTGTWGIVAVIPKYLSLRLPSGAKLIAVALQGFFL